MNEFDDLENTLAAELRHRSGDVFPTSGMADRARRRARVVRRRRAVAVGAVTAVALAIAVPTALSLRSVPQTAGEPAGPPTLGGTTELQLDGLPEGPPPAIGWSAGRTFHRADGSTVELPENVYDVLELADGFTAARVGDDGAEVVSLDDDGRVTDSRAGAGPVVSPDGSLQAYYDQDAGQLWAEPADGSGTEPRAHEVPPGRRIEPVGFLDGGVLVSSVLTPDGALEMNLLNDLAGGMDVDPTDLLWDLERVSAVSAPAGLVAGYTELRDDGSCSAVYEADAGEPLWETCDYSFDHFSPDGRYLVGSVAYRDGEGNPYAVVVDARTGEVVHTYEGRFINEATFEDDDHLLISVRLVDGDDRLAAILRCDLAGSCEVAAPVERLGQEEYRYGFGVAYW
ncbi:hypothetical protein [Jiangella mangrovi]|uniref:WD40 repeat domain-containing protein n=1 Tax=Jiangella mangrovi TaxID=1524084 RepID=A0A7W9GWI9_9ACTN|nr:hypothetical protein [Jiangella mangrovi]MBB5791287.1 hypothetical protein [Jiangella mangrovi]